MENNNRFDKGGLVGEDFNENPEYLTIEQQQRGEYLIDKND